MTGKYSEAGALQSPSIRAEHPTVAEVTPDGQDPMTPTMLRRAVSLRWYRFRLYDAQYAIPRWIARHLPYPLVRACVHHAALRAHWETRRPLNDVTYYDIWATWERPR